MPDTPPPPPPRALPVPAELAEVVEAVREGARTPLTRDGQPVAVLVPPEDAAWLEELEARQDAEDAALVAEARAEWAREGHTWPSVTLEDLAREHGIDLTAPDVPARDVADHLPPQRPAGTGRAGPDDAGADRTCPGAPAA